MKKPAKRIEIAALLSFALLCLSLNFGSLVSAQDTNRQRVIATPTKTPKTTPTPKQNPTPKQTPTPKPTAAPTVISTPTTTPTATPISGNAQSLADLQSRIRSNLLRPELQRGQVGIKVVSLDTGKIIFEQNAEKYFMPASNMKSFTVAAAMERLTPDFRFVTSVYAGAKPDSSGTVRGDLTIFGRGDPSFSTAFTRLETSAPVVESDYLKGLEALADKIVQSGVKRIEGGLVGDESYFNTDPIPSGWEWDDLQWYYGAEVSALTIDDNALDLSVKPTSPGALALVQLMPGNSLMTIINRTVTAPAGTERDLTIDKKLGQNVLEVSGKIPAGDKGYTGYIAVSRPALLFVTLLRRLLEQKGVTITGPVRAVSAKEKGYLATASTVSQVEITKLESPPLSVIAAKTMKPSQNLYTELILRALGEQTDSAKNSQKTSEAKGIDTVQNFLNQVGIAPGSVLQYDGCGLSRHDLVTPAALVQLYGYMNQRPYAQAWRDSLPIGGVDGTLRRRFLKTAAANNVRAKTGTIDQVSALSGYLTTASGERLAFSILTNGISRESLRTSTIDEIVVLLANFNGRTN